MCDSEDMGGVSIIQVGAGQVGGYVAICSCLMSRS